MTNWHCFKCKERMIDDEITLMYLEIDATVLGLACPVCGDGYITEEMAIGNLAVGEKKIEDK